jgi:cation diffusion facilitator CzcD-associated flavoprotein CzcO
VIDRDVLIVGAGFSGLYLLDRLRSLGHDVEVWEAGSGLGGTWYWNRYPGARVDSAGSIYQFSRPDLSQAWEYRERYPAGEEIRAYFAFADERLGLSADVRFGRRLERAVFDDADGGWRVRAQDGAELTARIVLLATGVLAKPYVPAIPGLRAFAGAIHHTAAWPHAGVDLAGKRVAVVGTGASGVQVVQAAAEVAAEVTVFQRTPAMAMPMRQRRLDPDDQRAIKAELPELLRRRADAFAGFDFDFRQDGVRDVDARERDAVFARLWAEGGLRFWLATFSDVLFDEEANACAYAFWRDRVRERIEDPRLADRLAPAVAPHPFGIKRVPLENGYFEAFNRDGVRLVDVREDPIAEITRGGIRTAGARHDADVIVLATGFDAVTGGLASLDIRGIAGRTLAEHWAGGIRTQLGVAAAGFPNLLMVDGPQTPSGLCNGPTWAEVQGEQIIGLLEAMRAAGQSRIEATASAEDAWAGRVATLFAPSLFDRAPTWYLGANVPGKRREMLLYPGGLPAYRQDWAEGHAGLLRA